MSLVDDLARIRDIQGKEPLPNPHVIQGFEQGSPVVPPYYPQERMPDPNEPLEDEYLDAGPPPEPAPSPLIPRRPAPAVAPPLLPQPKMVVVDRVAAWKGRDVALSETDEKAIRTVVLRAIAREVMADLAASGARRPRKPKARPEAILPDPPKRRGRPRKVQP